MKSQACIFMWECRRTARQKLDLDILILSDFIHDERLFKMTPIFFVFKHFEDSLFFTQRGFRKTISYTSYIHNDSEWQKYIIDE